MSVGFASQAPNNNVQAPKEPRAQNPHTAIPLFSNTRPPAVYLRCLCKCSGSRQLAQAPPQPEKRGHLLFHFHFLTLLVPLGSAVKIASATKGPLCSYKMLHIARRKYTPISEVKFHVELVLSLRQPFQCCIVLIYSPFCSYPQSTIIKNASVLSRTERAPYGGTLLLLLSA